MNSPLHTFARSLARASGGAVIFSLPILMTMEMWWLGFHMDRLKLVLLILVMVPLLTGLSFHSGFEETFNWKEDLSDGLIAYAIGFLIGTLILALFGVITTGMSPSEIVGKISIQAIPGSIGAILAQSQLKAKSPEEERREEQGGYGAEIFHMLAGAIFLALNVAPTDEMVLIAYQMSPWHGIALLLLSLLVMHAFVYAVEFHGQAAIPEGGTHPGVFLKFTVVGYALCLLVSAYMLWTFGRTEGMPITQIVMTTVVLGFPAAIGAAAARLIL
ncbi:MAG: TIGR02587 family membrane protein [Verrucomicrobiaceae bacterium]|nr:MAG: TIGR02587 family membrane protein [Verrucomicrobiaceae bacterium]